MNLILVWITGYFNPVKFTRELENKPAPLWGFYASLLRAFMDSIFIYLPFYLLKRIPPTPSFLTFIPNEKYYGALILLTPYIFLVQWLVAGTAVHVCLKLCKRTSHIDHILNISGMATLVVGALIVVWDWIWYFIGRMDQYLLGISHLVIDFWWIILFITGLKIILKVPVWLGILVTILSFAIEMPFAIVIMRSPY